jgi:hypothetical protein
MPPEAIKTKGIIAKITAELALNDVNLVGIMCCAPEDILLVTEKDSPRALETLQRILKEGSIDNRRNSEASTAVLTSKNPTPRQRTSLQFVTS